MSEERERRAKLLRECRSLRWERNRLIEVNRAQVRATRIAWPLLKRLSEAL